MDRVHRQQRRIALAPVCKGVQQRSIGSVIGLMTLQSRQNGAGICQGLVSIQSRLSGRRVERAQAQGVFDRSDNAKRRTLSLAVPVLSEAPRSAPELAADPVGRKVRESDAEVPLRAVRRGLWFEFGHG